MKFKKTDIRDWKGRYSRIPGRTPVFHLKKDGGRNRVAVYWSKDGEVATCFAADSAGVSAMTAAIEKAKVAMGGRGGGSFQINEFGQVLVPSQDGAKRMLAGEISGKIEFRDPWGGAFDLSDAEGCANGDDWKLPYVGMKFNLSKRSEIYLWQGEPLYPYKQDRELIGDIRRIRRYGAVRFIVNPWGIVLTKRPPDGEWTGDESEWDPVYVGRISHDNWFNKEKRL